MFSYCGEGSLTPIVQDHRISYCFTATLFPATALTFLLLSCVRLFSAKSDDDILANISKQWMKLQVLLCIICLTLDLSNFIVLFSVGNHSVPVFMIISLCEDIASWSLVSYLLYKDHDNNLPNSFFVLLFWTTKICETIISIYSSGSIFKPSVSSVLGTVYLCKSLLIGLIAILSFILAIVVSKKRKAVIEFSYASLGDDELAKAARKRREISFFKRIFFLAPYVWPTTDFRLQLNVVMCVGILIGGRIVNLFVPIIYKEIIDAITPGKHSTSVPFPDRLIGIWIIFKFLQGGGGGGTGLLNNMRSFLWIKITQYTSKKMKLKLFEHLHSLSLEWHLGRKTGEVLRIMDRGTDSVNNLLNSVVFSIMPTIVDIFIAIIYFILKFNALFGIIVMSTMVMYLVWTIVVTEWRTQFRKAMNSKDNEARAMSVDSLLNFETVKFFAAEKYEVNRYNNFITSYQDTEFQSQASLNLLNIGQSIIISGGLCLGTMLCGYQVSTDGGATLRIGDFVLFIAYMSQLYAPLNFFGTYWRMIQAYYVDMNNMFDLLDIEPSLDIPGALPLNVKNQGAKIEFRNVSFSYGDRLILNRVSFSVPAGQTFAIVGPSGAGKSSLLRLLFRFYDLQDGEILIDDQDIAKVQQESVRKSIGVVPQDCVLFNDTILYNINYGKVEAPEEEVYMAARAAEMHDKIIETFSNGYETQVGERGLRLSGGEKQRVAIARTILKDPAIVLLDEATSALDTETERKIQTSLHKICQHRTALVVAHRLSTIIGADCILVLDEGKVVESGSHQDLLDREGLYSKMWQRQLEIEQETPDNAKESSPNIDKQNLSIN